MLHFKRMEPKLESLGYNEVKLLGEGQFGTVYRVKDDNGNEYYFN